jgi:hypothetical protein
VTAVGRWHWPVVARSIANIAPIIATPPRSHGVARYGQWDLTHALRTDRPQIAKLERSERWHNVVDYLRVCRAIGLRSVKDLAHDPLAAVIRDGLRPRQIGCE